VKVWLGQNVVWSKNMKISNYVGVAFIINWSKVPRIDNIFVLFLVIFYKQIYFDKIKKKHENDVDNKRKVKLTVK